jgi:hypothetical protein
MRLTGGLARVIPSCTIACAAAAAVLFLQTAKGAQPPAGGGRLSDAWGSMGVQVLSYDDAEGYVEFTAQGNRGSHFTVRMDFTGIYVIPQLAASSLKRTTGIPSGTHPVDSYDIIPRNLKVTTDINGTYQHEAKQNGFVIRTTVRHKVDHHFVINVPPPPEGKRPVQEAMLWNGDIVTAQTKNDPNYMCVIRITDESLTGGAIRADVRAHVGLTATYEETHESNIPGAVSPRTSMKEGKYSLIFTALGDTVYSAQVSTRSWPLVRYLTSSFAITEPISWQDLRFVVSKSGQIAHSGQPSYGSLLSDTDYVVKSTLRMGPTKPLDVFLEPASSDESRWMPQPGQTREYTVTVQDKTLKDIDAVRVTLADTSSHPGVVTNGGNHLRGETCDDCRAGKSTITRQVNTSFGDVTGKDIGVSRTYRHYNMCPLDSMPDIFFRDIDNAGWTFGDEATSQSAALKYVAGQQMTRESSIGEQTRFTVRVMDGAASAQLSAEVRVAGVWYPVTARGSTADSKGGFLMLPLDANRDGIHDAWAAAYGVTDPDDDSGDQPAGAGPGDGLTAFEEYRGVYSRGQHRRLWPDVRELFVHDYSAVLGPGLNQASALYAPNQIELVQVRGDEFENEVINCRSEAPHKRGSQYVVVVMTAGQVPGVNLGPGVGKASHVGPPTKDANTVVIVTGQLAGTPWTPDAAAHHGVVLGHEIGHEMNMPHHGSGDGIRLVEGKPSWLAAVHGQHSGEETCLMRYHLAHYVFDGNPVPASLDADPLASGQIRTFSADEGSKHFCTTTSGGSACKDAATGGGSCLSRIKIRSY